VVCNMGAINHIAEEHGLYVIEDAAQAIGVWKATGDFGCLSFHYTKNIQCGQGGALIVKNEQFIEKAEVMMHCGTTKAKMYRGETEGYEWLEVGSQYVLADNLAHWLASELERLKETTTNRQKIWHLYKSKCPVKDKASTVGNGHIFWWFQDKKWPYIRQMRDNGIKISSHYDALHNTLPGKKYGRSTRIWRATDAQNELVKLDTSVSEEEAERTCEVLWGSATTRNIL